MAPQNNTHIVKLKKREPAIAVILVVTINVFILLITRTIDSFTLVVSGIFITYVLFSYFNEKLIYNDYGITIYEPFRKKCELSWDSVISIKAVLQDPRLTVRPGCLVVKISYTVNNSIGIKALPFASFTGLPELLDFYAVRTNHETQY